MRELLRLIVLSAVLYPAGLRAEGTCESCKSYDPACPRIVITEDNFTDHRCHADAVGKSLVDTDQDGIPDECGDRCPCEPNLRDDITGIGACPEPPAKPPADAAPEIGCTGGELTGIDTREWLAFVRPETFLYFSERDWKDPIVSVGPHVWVMIALDDFACRVERVGDKDSVVLTESPEVYWRGGFYIDPSLTGDTTFLVADSGVDYIPEAKYWSIGGQLHLLSDLQKGRRAGVNLGAGLRVGVLDAFAIIPFFQCDFRNDYDFSVGAILSLDLEMFEELGIRTDAIEKLIGE